LHVSSKLDWNSDVCSSDLADGVERGAVSYGTVGMDCVCHALIFRPSDGFEVLDSFGSEEFLLMHIAEIVYMVHEERTANVIIRHLLNIFLVDRLQVLHTVLDICLLIFFRLYIRIDDRFSRLIAVGLCTR